VALRPPPPFVPRRDGRLHGCWPAPTSAGRAVGRCWPQGRAGRAESATEARHAMGPRCGRPTHVWLIFVLVCCWTAYPRRVRLRSPPRCPRPLMIRRYRNHLPRRGVRACGGQGASRAAEYLFAISSGAHPRSAPRHRRWAAIRDPGASLSATRAGNPGHLMAESRASVLIGAALAVVFCGYLAAVYLAADSNRFFSERTLATCLPLPVLLAAGLVSGALALAGLFRNARFPALDLTPRQPRLVMVCVLPPWPAWRPWRLCWRWRFGLAG